MNNMQTRENTGTSVVCCQLFVVNATEFMLENWMAKTESRAHRPKG